MSSGLTEIQKKLVPQDGETGEQYQHRLALLRAAKDFPEFDPEEVVASIDAQQVELKAKQSGRRLEL